MKTLCFWLGGWQCFGLAQQMSHQPSLLKSECLNKFQVLPNKTLCLGFWLVGWQCFGLAQQMSLRRCHHLSRFPLYSYFLTYNPRYPTILQLSNTTFLANQTKPDSGLPSSIQIPLLSYLYLLTYNTFWKPIQLVPLKNHLTSSFSDFFRTH